jgi:hypothetical protein
VQVGADRSSEWTTDVGTIQGGVTSGDWYNISSVSLPSWNPASESISFADDNIEIVSSDTAEECQVLAQEAARKIAEWFDCMGLTLNHKKSEVVGFGFNPDPVWVGNEEIFSSDSIKFLGCYLQKDLSWKNQVNVMCKEIRKSASRIRFEGRLMGFESRKVLYHAWIGGKLLNNSRVIFPGLNSEQEKCLQRACNAGIRAIFRLPKRGQVDMDYFRRKANIDSVSVIKKQVELTEAWLKKPEPKIVPNIVTRSLTRGNIPTPDQRGWKRLISSTIAQKHWNVLPESIRKIEDKKLAQKAIKNYSRAK